MRRITTSDRVRLDRRELIRLGLSAAGAAAVGGLALPHEAFGDRPSPTSPGFTPFTQDLPVPETLVPGAAFSTTAPLDLSRPAAYYVVPMQKGTAKILPDFETPILGYKGQYPGPSIHGVTGRQDVIRFVNEIDVETSVHQHGGHNAPDFDGFPNDFTLPGKTPFAFKDYLYPNSPAGGDPNDNPSFLWYHDHAMDITGPNVYAGLAGLYPTTDALEDGLVGSGKLPATAFDVPLVLQDRRFNRDGTLFYDPFEHDGFLGDVFVVNGKAQPRFHVQPRRYRFRLLNGSNARLYMVRLSNDAPFLQIGADSWLLPRAVSHSRILLAMAERADVIVDFRNLKGKTVYLENILVQTEGRGPGGDLSNPDVKVPGVPLVQFIVDVPLGAEKEATIAAGDEVRPHTRIRPEEIAATREFEFARSNGAWVINGRFFDPARTDASPALGTAERWILKNGGGGWWHPIHIHDEAHQVVSFNGRPIPPEQQFKKDTTLLGPGDEAEVFIRFRDFRGRYVFHCHNIEHEDMRMMGRIDVK